VFNIGHTRKFVVIGGVCVSHWLLEREFGVAAADLSNIGDDSRSDPNKEAVPKPEASSQIPRNLTSRPSPLCKLPQSPDHFCSS
jgi:hypothetical protein